LVLGPLYSKSLFANLALPDLVVLMGLFCEVSGGATKLNALNDVLGYDLVAGFDPEVIT
jgi:hypothetical protein